MIYLIWPFNENKLDNNSVWKLWHEYFDINMNTTIIITKLNSIHLIMLYHGIKNGLSILWNKDNTTIMIRMFIST